MSGADAAGRWLAIVGIGEDGVEGLAPAARALVAGAGLVVGGARHLALAGDLVRGDRETWSNPLDGSLGRILARRGRPVCVLASGDPYCFGIGAVLARHVPPAETLAIPAPSAFALAAARLGWAAQDVATLSFCGRPIEPLRPLLQPGRRILALSADAATPAQVAAFLTRHGFGPSTVHLLEALGGPRERVRTAAADAVAWNDVDALNLLAIEVAAGPDARILPLAAGLDDAGFEHDGQLTRREIRALTLSSLAPRAGELLWDVGCGSGSVAIEWLLRNPAGEAIGIEPDPDRAARAARNAAALGTPQLDVRIGRAPAAFDGLPDPDAVFVGGGGSEPGLLYRVWQRLPAGGRLVANAVTIDTEAALADAHARLGGSLTRIAIERSDRVGRFRAYRPAMTVVQWLAVKP